VNIKIILSFIFSNICYLLPLYFFINYIEIFIKLIISFDIEIYLTYVCIFLIHIQDSSLSLSITFINYFKELIIKSNKYKY